MSESASSAIVCAPDLDEAIPSVEVYATRDELELEEETSSRSVRQQWTPTLRRVSLLNTLLFLGLALSNTKIQAHASSGGLNSNASPIESRSTEKQATSLSNLEGDFVDQAGRQMDVNPSSTEKESPLDVWLEEIEDESGQKKDESRGGGSGDSSHEIQDEVIIVATVDGTLAAIESSTGEVIWRNHGTASKSHRHNENKDAHREEGSKFPLGDKGPRPAKKASKLLNPLTTTTTTASSTSDSSILTAIPSINGNVFLTTVDSSKDARTTPNALTRTETASLKELVARAPYVDSSGRFYLGSVDTTAVAIDSKTGEILYVASAHGNDDEGNINIDPEWEGRSVVWLGRVDYSVSVYNGKSSAKEVQFSASEIMSVNDMVAEKRKLKHDPVFLSMTSERAPNLFFSPEEDLFQGTALLDANDPHQFSALVATPSGNLAYRNPDTGRVMWVANEVFETPIAYAIHSSSGRSLNVDIIPDVTMPSQSTEYLTREIERQIELTLGDGSAAPKAPEHFRGMQNNEAIQPSIVGTLLNGQLYSMPLGRRHQSALPSHSSLATSRMQTQQAVVEPTAGQRHQPTSSLTSFRDKHALANKMPLPVGKLPHTQDDRHYNSNHLCGPSSSIFPGCLFKAVQQRVVGSLKAAGSLQRKDRPFHENPDEVAQSLPGKSAAMETFSHQKMEQEIRSFQDQDDFQQQQRQRNYRRMLKILGSWLPPTIALLFVVSFELGRRKRQKDGLDVLKLADSNGDTNDLLRYVDQKVNNSSPRQMIQITDQVLGFGGHGTVVFRGMLEGRNVAVKRMLKTYLASADREISLLIESDGHPNVVRYFLKEVKGDFVYLALELCDLSLHALIGTLVAETKDCGNECEISSSIEGKSNATRRLLLQIATGVRHLHNLRIVHNDLKPQNILLALSKEVKSANTGASNESIYNMFQSENYVAKISDMGLGKMLAGQSSFGASASFRGQSGTAHSNGNVGIGPGTVGWMAPEAMRIKSIPSIASEASNSGDASPLDSPASSSARASRSVDVFSLGCIFYSTLVPGFHPFGEWYEREANIMHNRPDIEPLKLLAVEAYDLVSAMIQHNPRSRPTTKQICEHPFFWSLQRKLSFVCDLSDRLETDAASAESEISSDAAIFKTHSLAIERNAATIVGLNWEKALYKGLTEQRYRTYDSSSVRDLLRLLRNKKNHFQDLEVSVRQRIGSNTDGLMKYFESRFPGLLMHCYKVCCEILPPGDSLIEKYSLSSASYPVSYAFVATQVAQKVPPVLIEEPQFASQEELTQGELSLVVAPQEKAITHPSETAAPTSFGVEREKSLDAVGQSEHFVRCQASGLENTKLQTGATHETPAQIAIPLGGDEFVQNDVVLWEGSTASRKLNCRGWMRSDEEWTNCTGVNRKRNATLVRCAQDRKFRTRLCNHWDMSMGDFCPMKKKSKCVFAHGPVELRVKEGKVGRWGKLVDKNGNNSNPNHSGGEDTYGAARSIESARKVEGKWNSKKAPNGTKKNPNKKKSNKTA